MWLSGGGGRRRRRLGTTFGFTLLAGCLSNIRFTKVETFAVEIDKLACTLYGQLGTIAELGYGTLLLGYKRCRSRCCRRLCENVTAVLQEEDSMEGSYTLGIFGCFCISVDGPVVFGIEMKCASKVGISSCLDLTFFDGIDGIGTGSMQDVVLDGVLGVVEPRFLDETAIEKTMVVILNVLQRVVRKRLGRKELGGLGRCAGLEV